MHTFVFIPKTHSLYYYKEFPQPKLIYRHYTRNNARRIVEEIEQNQEVMRQDINQLNGKLDRLMDILQELANREQNPHPSVVENVIPEPQPTSAAVVGWPPFGLPPGYMPPQLENPTESGPSQPRPTQASVPRPNGTPVMQENADITVGFPIPQGTIENPLLVYHSSNPSKGK